MKEIAEKLRILQKEYKAICKRLIVSLESTSVRELTAHAAILPHHVRVRYKELTPDKHETTKLTSSKLKNVPDFVWILNSYSYCLNPSLLEEFIIEFGDEGAKSQTKAFRSRLETFAKQTRLTDLAAVDKGLFALLCKDCHMEHEQIEVKLKDDWDNKTLKDLMAIQPNSWCIKRVDRGCLRVVFIIPDKSDLEKQEVKDFLKQNSTRYSIGNSEPIQVSFKLGTYAYHVFNS